MTTDEMAVYIGEGATNKLNIGKYTLSEHQGDESKIIIKLGAEGGSFDKSDLEQLIGNFYGENF